MYVQEKNGNNDNKKTVQRKKTSESVNLTGLSDNTKAKYENMSGFSFDDVRVHYNSSKPAQLKALAYTQGNQIFVGPRQETHLNHELGHVIQQKQGKVVPTSYYNGIPINDDSALESEADNICHTPPRQISASDFSGSSPTVQMLRKRVKGSDRVTPDDIFYDKNDGKYYDKITATDNQTAEMKDGTEWNHYKKAKSKDRSVHTIIAAETTSKDEFIDVNNFNTDEIKSAPSYSGTLFSAGRVMQNPPISVRLYAEGNFDHAVALADTMAEEKEFNKLMNLDPSMKRSEQPDTPEQLNTPVLIKGTEFDSREGLKGRYKEEKTKMREPKFNEWIMKQHANYYRTDGEYNNFVGGYQDYWYQGHKFFEILKRERYYNKKIYEVGKGYAKNDYKWYPVTINDFTKIDEKLDNAFTRPNLESSLGTNEKGGTGDLSREPKKVNPSKRQYDLIQSTFFWLPRKESSETEEKLMLFLKNQYTKLKVNGVIRITLANCDSESNLIYNQYKSTAASILSGTKTGDLNCMYECKLIELKNSHQDPVTYSSALQEKGLNPDEKFKHTQTKKAVVVDTTDGDLIIQARKLDENERKKALAQGDANSLFEKILPK